MQSDITQFLRTLSANCDRAAWIEIGGAFKSAGGTFESFDQWSATAPAKYSAADCRTAWSSLAPSGNPEGAAGWLRKAAKDAGGYFPDEPRQPRRMANIPSPPSGGIRLVTRTRPPSAAIPPPPPAAPMLQGKPAAPQSLSAGEWSKAKQGDAETMRHYIKGAAANSAETIKYFCDRRGLSPEIVTTFQLGFDPNDRAAVIPYSGESYCVRRFAELEADSHGASKYDNPRGAKPVFNGGALQESRPVFICEGQIDALSIIDAGGAACTGLNEPGMFLPLASVSTASGFLLVRDPDEHGEMVCNALKKKLTDAGKRCEIAAMPPGIADPNELLRQQGRDALAAWIAVQVKKFEIPDTCETLAAVWDNPPPRAPELITGLLRQGHKMILSGTSKAGKSFALLQLAAALAEGREWLGTFSCKPCPILYLNLEIDRPSMIHRAHKVYAALGWTPHGLENFIFDHLRGHTAPIEEMENSIINKAKAHKVAAVFVDPVYKCGLEDENSAQDISIFCRALDRIANETGAAVIYCHHFSKGAQDCKSPIDRASGSGVFARDADAILTLTELQEPGGFRLESILREFKNPTSLSLRFDYPLHVPAPDLDTCPLKGMRGAFNDHQREAANRADQREQEQKRRLFEDAKRAAGILQEGESMTAADFRRAITGQQITSNKSRIESILAVCIENKLLIERDPTKEEKTSPGVRKMIERPAEPPEQMAFF